jgi:hypothetical protein
VAPEILPTQPEFSRAKGASGIPFRVDPIESKHRAMVRVFFTEVQET